MKCPKCKSRDVRIQTINEVELKNAHHGVLWWLFVGWWWVPVKWIHFTVLALIFKLFGRKKQKAVNRRRTVATCQTCGHSWNV